MSSSARDIAAVLVLETAQNAVVWLAFPWAIGAFLDGAHGRAVALSAAVAVWTALFIAATEPAILARIPGLERPPATPLVIFRNAATFFVGIVAASLAIAHAPWLLLGIGVGIGLWLAWGTGVAHAVGLSLAYIVTVAAFVVATRGLELGGLQIAVQGTEGRVLLSVATLLVSSLAISATDYLPHMRGSG